MVDTVSAHLELTPFIGVRGPLGAGGGHEASLGRGGKRGCSVARSGRKQVAQLGRRSEPRVERGKCDCFSPRLCGTFQGVSQLQSWGLPGATAVPARLALRLSGGGLQRARPARDRRGADGDGHACPAHGGENPGTSQSVCTQLETQSSAQMHSQRFLGFFCFFLQD